MITAMADHFQVFQATLFGGFLSNRIYPAYPVIPAQ